MLKDVGIEVDREQNLYATSAHALPHGGEADGTDGATRHVGADISQLTLEQVCSYESALKA